MPIISIIVPVYNMSAYLDKCLTSLVNQSFRDIEIICIDDHSSDGSNDILLKWQKKDDRIKAYYFTEHKGTSYARKYAGMRSIGKYVMFCDADDTFEEQACEIVVDEMERDPVDILHYQTRVTFLHQYEQERVLDLENRLKPYMDRYTADSLIVPCYQEKRWGKTLWNKAYNGEKCRKAFARVYEADFSIATDVYLFFLISYFCKSYRGIDKCLYIYQYGTGISSYQTCDFTTFKKTLDRLKAIEGIDLFIQEESPNALVYECARNIRRETERDIVNDWQNTLALPEKRAGYDLLLSVLGAETLIGTLAELYWFDQEKIISYIAVSRNEVPAGRPVKKIGLYYPTLQNGGAQRVVCKLATLFIEMGYYIVLITDEKPSEEDYDYPESVVREQLPLHTDSISDRYMERAQCWLHIIENNQLDTVVYNLGITDSTLFDFCTIKAGNANLVAFYHGIFCSTLWYSLKTGAIEPLAYRLTDRIICLSRMDKHYWSSFSKSYFIPNPMDFPPQDQISELSSGNILWVGRISPEKNPDAVLKVFASVVDRVPYATLTIVGSALLTETEMALKKMADSLCISDRVLFAGFQKNVSCFYQHASVLCFTSRSEGWPLVLSEAKAFGIPIVMFDLPWIEFVRDGRGIEVVPQGDIHGMADKLVALLTNDELRLRQGKLSRESIEEMSADLPARWSEVFDGIEYQTPLECSMENRLMLSMIHLNMIDGVNSMSNSLVSTVNRHEEVVNRHEASINHQWEVQKWHEKRLQEVEKQNAALTKALKKLTNSRYYRFKSAIKKTILKCVRWLKS